LGAAILTDIFFILKVFYAVIVVFIVYISLIVGHLATLGWQLVQFLFVNWIVQAFFAAWVAFKLQQVHHERTQKAARFEKRYDQKIEIVRQLFGLVDRRIYATRTYKLFLQSADLGWPEERVRYREVVRKWNEEAPGLLVIMQTILPQRYCLEFDHIFFPKFATIDSFLGRQRTLLERESPIDVTLAAYARVMLAEFINTARSERRLIDRVPEINFENIDSLGCGYLIKSLFKSRM
jgi:hypothetical protein